MLSLTPFLTYRRNICYCRQRPICIADIRVSGLCRVWVGFRTNVDQCPWLDWLGPIKLSEVWFTGSPTSSFRIGTHDPSWSQKRAKTQTVAHASLPCLGGVQHFLHFDMPNLTDLCGSCFLISSVTEYIWVLLMWIAQSLWFIYLVTECVWLLNIADN